MTAMGDDKLKLIAADLITQVKKSVSIDWTLRESARQNQGDGEAHPEQTRLLTPSRPAQSGFAQRFTLSILVGPLASRDSPDLQEEAVKTVLAQAELLCAEWV